MKNIVEQCLYCTKSPHPHRFLYADGGFSFYVYQLFILLLPKAQLQARFF